ncbi:MAG: DUF5818 domain-containing protein [Deltaproteobacteria bacterium]
MKLHRTRLFPWAAVAALGVGLIVSAPAIGAQSQAPNSSAQKQPDQKPGDPPQQGQATSKTYVGQIIQAQNGQFALLTDKNAGRGYFLDDQEKAKKFTGKNVKVTGTVDTQTKTLHIAQIETVQPDRAQP